MNTRNPKRQRFRWSIGATVIALSLWAILSLSQTYTWDLSVPFSPVIDTTSETLSAPVPRTVSVSFRGDGWTLMQLRLFRDLECRVRPIGQPTASDDTSRVFTVTEQELIRSISTPSSIQVESVRPGTVRLSLTDIATKKVPLTYPEVSIGARKGFQVIGRIAVAPDSVLLRGPSEVLGQISRWHTKPLDVDDVYEKIDAPVPVNDSLYGVISVEPATATVKADVQEVAEIQFEGLRISNRETVSDSTVRLQLYPDRVTITLRGGAKELASLEDGDVIPYVNCAPSVDTTGYAVVRVSLPPEIDARVIAIEPSRIRYVWRRIGISGEGSRQTAH
jgi:hypothetical protein